MSPRKLVVFSRYPEAGRSKTRLIPALGPEGAARLQRRLTELTIERARKLRLRGVQVELWYAGGDSQRVRRWLGDDIALAAQTAGDLGARMLAAFEACARQGCQATVVIGTDAPGLSETLLHEAFVALERSPVVLGPATDGGYYLIGLQRPVPALFSGVDWGSERVLEQTISRARAAELSFELLAPLPDIDRPEDLPLARDLLLLDPAEDGAIE